MFRKLFNIGKTLALYLLVFILSSVGIVYFVGEEGLRNFSSQWVSIGVLFKILFVLVYIFVFIFWRQIIDYYYGNVNKAIAEELSGNRKKMFILMPIGFVYFWGVIL